MSGAFCSDCKRQTDVVLDHSAGNAMCSECGLILESHSTDETPEWRIFADADGPSNKDPAPVGGPTNPLLDDTAFSTPVPKRKRTSRESPSSSGSISEWNLMLALQTIATIADRLGLVATIKDRANDIRKRLGYFKSSHWKNQDALLAACLYIACRQEVKPITINEISSVVNGATKTDIGRAKDYILKQLGLEEGESVEMGTIHAGDLITRFCSHLGMNDQATKAAQESVQKLEEIYIKRSPISTAAVLIYIITQLSDDKKPLEDISLVAGIAEGTIKTSYWDVYPHISKIIPSWYATEEDLKNLSSP